MKHMSAIFTALGTALALATLVAISTTLTEGRWIYTLDDAYIHLALAKNFALHGVWGLTPDTPVFCSSSPLWTLALAGCMKIFGCREWIAGVLNIVCAALVMWRCDCVMERGGVAVWPRMAASALIFFLTPLAVVAMTGMEHTLHVLLVLLLVTSKRSVSLLVFSFLAAAARFESLAVIAPLAGVLLLERRWKTALGMMACGLAPVVAHGVYAVAHGGFFLPNSILLKGSFDVSIQRVFAMYTHVSLVNAHLHILCLLLLLTACSRRASLELRRLALVLSAACVAHVTFGQCGNFYRYEAYLVVPSLLLLALAWARGKIRLDTGDAWLLASRATLVVALCLPLFLRGTWANLRNIRGAANIYEQQFVLADIFRALPGPPAIAINDLGVVSWLCENPVLDLWGLGTPEVARHKRNGTYDAGAIGDLLERHNAAYIAVFERWFPRAILPAHYQLVAELKNTGNVVCLEDTVRIYAVDAEHAARLHKTLDGVRLPRGSSIILCDFEKD